ncbi:hypothetical protein H5410_035968 [Solanum commersonii]|uniref:At2g35280-like TPR domain-containing protein n=1 Tax=Solanum commersonii TaxID=4109 RepID=A0A9J5Y559_SOLCO|nr:hypothetical protein H5410_035968 [Solanum commersonii]
MEELFVGIDCRGEWVEKKNRYIWRWKDVMEKCVYNCQLKDLVMSYIPHFFHNEKVLPFKIIDQPSLVVYLRGAERLPILRVYVDENPIEENHNLEEDQQDMLNDEFDDRHNPPIPIVGSNIPYSSQSSYVNNVRDDETGFYKGMTFKNKEKLANSLKIACLKKDFRLKKHAKSNVRETHEHGYAVLNAYHYMLKIANPGSKTALSLDENGRFKDLVPKAAETLERIGFHTWSRAFCSGNRYNIMTSNIAESVNSMFDVEREFPIVIEKYLLHMLIKANLEEGDIRDGVELVNHFQQEKISGPYVGTLATKELHAQIEMLHKELLIDIVERIASYSLKDLIRVKLRVLNEVANEPSVHQKVTLVSIPYRRWSTVQEAISFLEMCRASGNLEVLDRKGVVILLSILVFIWPCSVVRKCTSFLEMCRASGNLEALYRKGVYDFFKRSDSNGLGILSQAANGGHIGASYVLAIISIFNGGESMREGMMFIANMTPLKLRRCREKLLYTLYGRLPKPHLLGERPICCTVQNLHFRCELCRCDLEIDEVVKFLY